MAFLKCGNVKKEGCSVILKVLLKLREIMLLMNYLLRTRGGKSMVNAFGLI